MLNKTQKRIKRVRSKISGTAQRPRLAVFRSNREIYAQLIDDQKGVTLAAANGFEMKDLKPIEKAAKVGTELAQKAMDAKIKTAVFDRRGYKYHGQVKALAEAARAKGLKI